MNLNTPGLPVHHQLPESTQTHVHRVGDAIQPSRPLPPPSPLAFSLSQHQGLFQGVHSLHHMMVELTALEPPVERARLLLSVETEMCPTGRSLEGSW